MKKNKNPQASILVSTVIVLSLIMVTFLNFLFISNIERQSATSSNDSLLAYQMADTGVEAVLQKITTGIGAGDVKFGGTSWDILSTGACNSTSGLITVSLTGGNYVVELYKRATPTSQTIVLVNCSNPTPGIKYSEILKIKVVGMLTGKASRAVDAFVPIVN